MSLGVSAELRGLDFVRLWKDRMKAFAPVAPRDVAEGPLLENVYTGAAIDLLKFPVPRWNELDGGRYIGTDCVVVTRDPDEGWVNLGTYRVVVHDRDRLGLYISPGKDGRIQMEKAHARGEPFPVAITELAKEIGFPVIIKASAGGGGKGMRIVWEEAEFQKAFQTARTEAEAAFANGDVYIEKFIENPRHIEIQIMGDQHGTVYHYGERDCSVQRRHQKLIEESPSPAVDEELRKKMGEAAVRGAHSVNYEGAGTIEFLLDKHGNFYFMEMNTRIQVEHPVTEIVYDVELVRQQILVAAGEKIEAKPKKPHGHAIEFRINAEDPDNNFRPSPGKITSLHFPGGFGIRLDSHIYQSYSIPPYYDSLVAKLIVWGTDRQYAIMRAKRALNEFIIEGIKTTIPFHLKVLEDPRFMSGNFDTSFLEKF